MMKVRLVKTLAVLLIAGLAVPGLTGADGMVPPDILTMAEGTGTILEVGNPGGGSTVLTSSEEIRGFLEVEGGAVTIYLEPNGGTSTLLTVSGLVPGASYYLYVDSLANPSLVTAGGAGSVSFVQDMEDRHRILLKGNPSTVFLSDLGWSDPSVGTWDPSTMTAVLTTDLADTIEIQSSGITLDGNGHTLTGAGDWTVYDDGIYLTGVQNVLIRNLTITDFSVGIDMYQASSNVIQNVTFVNNGRGVHMNRCWSNIIEDSRFEESFYGIFISIYSGSNVIRRNTMTNGSYGMYYLAFTPNHTVEDNLFVDNGEGIYLWDSDGGTYTRNTIINSGVGLNFQCNYNWSRSPDWNQVYNNNFIGNTVQAYSCGRNNVYDIDDTVGGNHWSDWTGPDADGDGVVDAPYLLYEEGKGLTDQDNRPWATPGGWIGNRAPEFLPIDPISAVQYDVIEFVLDVTDPDGDAIASLYAEGLPAGASFDEATGAFSWRPDGNQTGIFVVSFNAVDDGTPAKTGQLDVVITVGDVESPTDLTETIIDDVLADDLPVEVENSYLANLKKVVEMIEEGRITPALNQLEAFIHKVSTDVGHGNITPAQGDLYIMMAQDVIDLLTGN